MLEILFFGTAFVATLIGIVVFRRYGDVVGMLDIPNERSSHSAPTLRGAGVAIVGVCLALYIAAAIVTSGRVSWSYVVGALIIAGVSWIDDVKTLPASVRFVAHGLAAAILIYGSGILTNTYIPKADAVNLSWLIQILSFLWIVWMVNAYNFMDGIDGIAGSQAVVAGLGWAVMGFLLNDQMLYLFGGIAAFASLGFLVHNWSPAAVFMGDVGSAFLGFSFAALPLLVDKNLTGEHPWLFLAAASFVWMFFFDTVFTFFRRLLKGERVWVAHRQHLYQRLVISGFSHSSVSLLYAVLALIVAATFTAAFLFHGIFELLLILTYLAVPAVVIFFAFRKKV